MAASQSSSLCYIGRAIAKPSMLALPRTTATNYSTSSRILTRAMPSTRPSSTLLAQQIPAACTSPALSHRHASTSTSTSTSSTSTSSTTTTAAQPPTLTWNDFLTLRRTRRYVNLGASIFSGAGSIAAATPLIAESGIEDLGAQITGLDPMYVIGGSLMGIGVVGWLMGPFLGTAVFRAWKSGVAGEFARKEKDFYAHVKRYRADPASSSVNNPVPDYYGEKIGSVADYRRWLKDQRAFNRKKNKNMI